MGGGYACHSRKGGPGSCSCSKLWDCHIQRAVCASAWESSQPARLRYGIWKWGCSQWCFRNPVSGESPKEKKIYKLKRVPFRFCLIIRPFFRSFHRSKTLMGHLQVSQRRDWMMAQGISSSCRMEAKVASASAVQQQEPLTSWHRRGKYHQSKASRWLEGPHIPARYL